MGNGWELFTDRPAQPRVTRPGGDRRGVGTGGARRTKVALVSEGTRRCRSSGRHAGSNPMMPCLKRGPPRRPLESFLRLTPYLCGVLLRCSVLTCSVWRLLIQLLDQCDHGLGILRRLFPLGINRSRRHSFPALRVRRRPALYSSGSARVQHVLPPNQRLSWSPTAKGSSHRSIAMMSACDRAVPLINFGCVCPSP